MSDAREDRNLLAIEKLEARHKRLKARLDKARALQSHRSRKVDAHRKILIGAIVLARARTDAHFAQTLLDVLSTASLKSKDRRALCTIDANLSRSVAS
jgi:hypothetical protein